MEFHEACLLWPLDEENLPALAASIKENGLLVPIALYEGKILDGRRRYFACKMAGIEPQFIELDDDDVDNDPVSYTMSMNLYRASYTEDEGADALKKAAEFRKDKETENGV